MANVRAAGGDSLTRSVSHERPPDFSEGCRIRILRAFSLMTVAGKSTPKKLRSVDQTEAVYGTGNWRLLHRIGDDIQAITEDESLERFGFRSSSCAFGGQGGGGEECRSGWQ